jgi:hypothetical protein
LNPTTTAMSLTRHFCCCLPVRLGVFVLSLLSLVGGGIYAAAVWYAYNCTYIPSFPVPS